LPAPAAPSSQWEGGPRALLITLLAIGVLLLAAYHYGIPVAARFAAAQVPDSVTTRVGDAVLSQLEREALRPTVLPSSRQRQIAAAFASLMPADTPDRYRLLFRSSPDLGANALALPSGTIVVTDALVTLARDDREILGVLAHEAGHVAGNHGMRLVFQSSALAIVVGLLVGDFASIIAIAPTVLLQAKYSRDFEREADAYAADLLRRNGITPSVLADLLERMEAVERSERGGRLQPDQEPGRPPDSGEGVGAPSTPTRVAPYVSSHPATAERLDYLRGR
jgi:Zn-dependent protease with chaperone function